jgi:hypothetical protein
MYTMRWFLIELWMVGRLSKQELVKAKDYGAACIKLALIHGESNAFKLLGVFEPRETDKNILERVA